MFTSSLRAPVVCELPRTSEMKQCAILMFADDLSGASDSGAEFFRRGLCTEIVLQSNERQELDSTCNNALVLDTDSRTADKQEAIARLRKAIELTSNVDANVCYKKIDSTLRGNVALVRSNTMPLSCSCRRNTFRNWSV